MNENPNQITIGFKSKGIWTTNDLSLLSFSVGGIYDAFLTKKIYVKYHECYLENLDYLFHKYEKYLDHPALYDYYKLWKESFHLWRKTKFLHPLPPFPPFNIHQMLMPSGQELPEIEYMYSNLDFYSDEAERLQIYRIKMSSPGGFNFQGIGEIVEQFRELIKDLWYRNRQEKVKGDLEIIKIYMDIRRENKDAQIPPLKYLQKRNILIDRTYQNVKKLKELENQNKLEDIGKNIDYMPR